MRVAAVAAVVCFGVLLGLSGPQSPDVQAQAGAVEIVPNVVDNYLGPEVVLSGKARSASGITDVTVTVLDVASGQYVQDPTGLLGPTAVPLDTWTALLPPYVIDPVVDPNPVDPGVSWRAPLSLVPGSYEVTITATDGVTPTTGDPLPFTVGTGGVEPVDIVASGSTWSYYDEGNKPVGLWQTSAFNDSLWATGPALLGYGNGNEATVTRAATDDGETVITQYFRQRFEVADPSAFDSIVLSLQRNDGAIVYLNGDVILRSNIKNGSVNYDTLALSSSDAIDEISLSPSQFEVGENLLAVEVHQVSPDSIDLNFDLSVVGQTQAAAFVSDNTPGTYVLTAGDMAVCNFEGDEAVAAQMGELFDTDAGVFLGLGDLTYNSGSLFEFQTCYDDTIGQFKDVTWPNAGNHEHYTTPNAAGYRAYFGPAAGPQAGPNGGLWYAFDIDDDWTAIALDSDCRGVEVLPGAINGDGCAVGSEQELWLRATLEANKDRNLLAFFHHPPYTNNNYQDHDYTWPLWRALAEYGVELTLHGHEHHYERYAQLDYWGDRDTTGGGVREFIIGSGGRQPRYDIRPQVPESDYRGTFPQGTFDFGVLQLWLRPDGYDWKWESIFGNAAIDQGTSGLNPPMPLSTVSGTVTALEDGTVLEGAEVCAVAQRTGLEVCQLSGADGTFSIDGVLAGPYSITATLSGRPTATISTTVVAPAPVTLPFELEEPPAGDVNCDALRNIVDALLIAQFDAGIRTEVAGCPLGAPEDDLNTSWADVDASGSVNIVDALFIAQCDAGISNIACP